MLQWCGEVAWAEEQGVNIRQLARRCVVGRKSKNKVKRDCIINISCIPIEFLAQPFF